MTSFLDALTILVMLVTSIYLLSYYAYSGCLIFIFIFIALSLIIPWKVAIVIGHNFTCFYISESEETKVLIIATISWGLRKSSRAIALVLIFFNALKPGIIHAVYSKLKLFYFKVTFVYLHIYAVVNIFSNVLNFGMIMTFM